MRPQGLNHKVDDIIEVGYVVWDTDKRSPVQMGGSLIKITSLLSPLIKDLTGITDKQLSDFGRPIELVLGELAEIAKKCDYLVGHNAISFDRNFLSTAFKKQSLSFPDLPWIDTRTDIDYPKEMINRKLVYLAEKHGVLMQNAHRATFDVMMTLLILDKYHDKFSEIVSRIALPFYQVIGEASFAQKEVAKSLGFHWDGLRKKWCRTCREDEIKSLDVPFSFVTAKISDGSIKGI